MKTIQQYIKPFWKRNNYSTIFFFIIFLSCQTNDLYQMLDKQISLDNTKYVLIATDYDCITCNYSIQKRLQNKKNIKAIYFTEYPRDFLVKLKKIFPNLKWKKGKNKKLLKYLQKQKEEAPYLIRISNDEAYIVNNPD